MKRLGRAAKRSGHLTLPLRRLRLARPATGTAHDRAAEGASAVLALRPSLPGLWRTLALLREGRLMPHPSKTKGDRCEVAVVHYLTPYFPNVRRGKAGGEADLGDIFGVVDRDSDAWTLQVADRNWRAYGEIERKAEEAESQALLAGTPFWCLIVKRARCTDVGRWFVYLPMSALIEAAEERSLTEPTDAWKRLDAGPEFAGAYRDLACITVRSWLALVAPSPVAAP